MKSMIFVYYFVFIVFEVYLTVFFLMEAEFTISSFGVSGACTTGLCMQYQGERKVL